MNTWAGEITCVRNPHSPPAHQAAFRLGRALRLVWRTAPRWTLVNTALVVVQGGLPLAALYVMKRIVDAVTSPPPRPTRRS